MTLLIIVLLLVILLGPVNGFYETPYRNQGFGLLGLILVIVLILALLGQLPGLHLPK